MDWSAEGVSSLSCLIKDVAVSNLLRSAVLLPGALAVSEAIAAAGGAVAFLSSSSPSDPPELLPSEATGGAFLPSPVGTAPEEAPTSAHAQAEKLQFIRFCSGS